jgi:hypothetical protein
VLVGRIYRSRACHSLKYPIFSGEVCSAESYCNDEGFVHPLPNQQLPSKEDTETVAPASEQVFAHVREKWEKTGSEGLLRKELKEI